ncbi:MAG: hypothetical protein HQL17_02280 [Candidatus Omnitrophica bacterium]|nr:hypothetical protein [Candidatus Omnitrophota bacterium]
MFKLILSSVIFLTIFFPSCVHAAIPAHAQADMFGRGWTCDPGYVKKDELCEPLVLPAHARVNLLSDGWECQKGYVKMDNGCQLMRIPPNAERDSFGNGWRCQRGYAQEGNECFAIKIPMHGQLNALGNDWQCQNGFKKKLNVCIDMEPPEKDAQNKYLRDQYAREMMDQKAPTGPCRAGYNKCTSACSALDRKDVASLIRTDDPMSLCFQACAHGEMLCAREKGKNDCGQFAASCPQFCPKDMSLCLGACQDGTDRCVYQAQQVVTK